MAGDKTKPDICTMKGCGVIDKQPVPPWQLFEYYGLFVTQDLEAVLETIRSHGQGISSTTSPIKVIVYSVD